MGKLVVLLLTAILVSGCIGGEEQYTFDQGMNEMNAIIHKYDNAQSEPELLKMRGEIYDLYVKVDEMEASDDTDALRLVLLFRINFFDARMVQNAAKADMDKFDFNCENIEDFYHSSNRGVEEGGACRHSESGRRYGE